MKLPFDFGIRFILRLAAPGALLAAVLLPATRLLAALIYPGLHEAALLTTSGLILGFAFLLLDMPIYMVLEGRRFWPEPIRQWAVGRQAAALASIMSRANAASGARKVEFDIQASQYPLDRASGEPNATYPTRLGNLLASFETYPTVKYGLDGVFFWPRLWVAIDKDLREELDSAQAVVDGALYASFAFAISAPLCLCYWRWLPSLQWWHWPAGAFCCGILAVVCYRLALPRYAQYGELFKATFDQFGAKLALDDAFLAQLDTYMGETRSRSDREAHRARWRFLRWHLYRRPGAPSNETVKNW